MRNIVCLAVLMCASSLYGMEEQKLDGHTQTNSAQPLTVKDIFDSWRSHEKDLFKKSFTIKNDLFWLMCAEEGVKTNDVFNLLSKLNKNFGQMTQEIANQYLDKLDFSYSLKQVQVSNDTILSEQLDRIRLISMQSEQSLQCRVQNLYSLLNKDLDLITFEYLLNYLYEEIQIFNSCSKPEFKDAQGIFRSDRVRLFFEEERFDKQMKNISNSLKDYFRIIRDMEKRKIDTLFFSTKTIWNSFSHKNKKSAFNDQHFQFLLNTLPGFDAFVLSDSEAPPRIDDCVIGVLKEKYITYDDILKASKASRDRKQQYTYKHELINKKPAQTQLLKQSELSTQTQDPIKQVAQVFEIKNQDKDSHTFKKQKTPKKDQKNKVYEQYLYQEKQPVQESKCLHFGFDIKNILSSYKQEGQGFQQELRYMMLAFQVWASDFKTGSKTLHTEHGQWEFEKLKRLGMWAIKSRERGNMPWYLRAYFSINKQNQIVFEGLGHIASNQVIKKIH